MDSPKPAPIANIVNMLAIELFKRVNISMGMGAIGVGIMFFAHRDVGLGQRPLFWSLTMMTLFVIRTAVARRGLVVAKQDRNPIGFVNWQAFLCGMTGLGWVGTLYLFDSAAMDFRFNLRLVIVAAAMTFTVSSMAVFKRVFFAYLAGIAIPLLIFILTREYVHVWNALLPSATFYVAMIVLVSHNTNRHIRAAIGDNLQVLILTEKLQQALDTEKRLRAELGIRADTDDLTGIFNRRGLMTQLHIELARCRRFPRSVAALMIDIDNFKRINDTHGHASGDQAIIAMVSAVKKQLRDTDIFGRLGGEEFLVLLPELAKSESLAVAERIRSCIESTPIALSGDTIRITVSVGVALYAADDNADRLLARADDALYAAKRNGRNRVELEVRDGAPDASTALSDT